MTTRRNFLKTGSISLAGLLVGEKVYSAVSTPDNKKSFSTIASKVTGDYASKRPAPEARKFTSKAVEEQLKASKARIKDPKLAWMFENCYPNTLDTTCEFKMVDGKPDTFVITGDIHAMWLRDSRNSRKRIFNGLDSGINTAERKLSRTSKCVLST